MERFHSCLAAVLVQKGDLSPFVGAAEPRRLIPRLALARPRATRAELVSWVILLALVLVGLLGRDAAAADPGLKVFIQKRCYTCHTISARSADVEKEKAAFIKETGVEPEEGEADEKETRGGDLSDVGKKRDAAWLQEFMKSPKGHFKDDAACQREAKKKDRKKFKGTPAELDALMAFLASLKQEAKQAPGFTSCLKE